MKTRRTSGLQVLALAVLLGAPSCSSTPKKIPAEKVPHAIEQAELELADGRSERALERMRSASLATGLPTDTLDHVRALLERAAEARIRELSEPKADPEDLAELVEMDLPRQIAVSAGIQAARRMREQGEPMDAYDLVKLMDTKYPLHHERAAAGELLADIGMELSKDHSKFLFFYNRQDDAQEVLEYLILNYPRAPRCDEAYSELSRIYRDDRNWSLAIDRLEKLVLNHPASPLRAESEAKIPRVRLSSIGSPEYDRGALQRARNELEAWLRSWPSRESVPPELENHVRLDLADCLRRLSDSDRNIAEFYARVGNDMGARRHAVRAVEEARQARDEGRIEEAEQLLRELQPEAKAPAASDGAGL